MSIKRKLMLIGICIGIILIVLAVNVFHKMKSDKDDNMGELTVTENVISRAEAYRLISYLEYDKVKREALSVDITYADQSMSGWYDSYVNAIWKMGLIESNVTIAPKEALTYGACKELLDKLIIKNPNFQNIYSKLTFNFMKAEEEMLLTDFLEIYEAILADLPQEEKQIYTETLFVLGNEIMENGSLRMVTDMGKYYYQDAKDYEAFLKKLNQTSDAGNTSENIDNSTVESTVNNNESSDIDSGNDLGKDSTSIEAASNKDFINQYLDKGIQALVCGQEIIYIRSITLDKIVLHNVWIKKGEGVSLDTFVSGIDKSFAAKYKLKTNIEKVVGDITIENQRVVQISVKPDMIQGKVLQTGKDFIEIEGYGKVSLDPDYKIYKLYGKMSLEPTGSILVGYKTTNFVVSEGKISAALITESIKAENIRVLIRTTGFKEIYHTKVEFTATSDFTISSKNNQKSYTAGDTVTLVPGDALLSDGRIKISTANEEGKIQLLSITRSNENPKYRGSIEVSVGENGLLVVNELPLEEYLYAVIPSEMPTYYGAEALKVQAVCARSYAYKHLLANSLSQYGAHVDDSVSYQVYNNISENETSILAVKDTYGKVIQYNGDVITAFYFSTSCGHTTEAQNVWANGTQLPYLNGKLIVAENGEGIEAQEAAINKYQDLSVEETFRSFIEDKDITTLDSSFNWYRWNVTMEVKEIKKVIDANLASRYNANPNLILTMTSSAKDGKEAVFESIPVDTVGDIVDISVLKRETGGIISELLITGSKNTIKVKKEYNIRALLAPTYDTVTRQDDSKVDNLSLLPSAFFVIDQQEKDGKLNSITLIGGGYGHGAGMSQNAVKALTDAGKAYEDIVTYFYDGTELGFIYE
jgi:stage II sporulation protein D